MIQLYFSHDTWHKNLNSSLFMGNQATEEQSTQKIRNVQPVYVHQGAESGWFNKNMPSYQYRKSHCGDKTIMWSSYLYNGISYTGKTSLYWISALCIIDHWLKTFLKHEEWGLLSQFPMFHYFLNFSVLSKHHSPSEYHISTWQVSLQFF